MKKTIATVVLILALAAVLVACNSSEPPTPAWADNEVLVYSVTSASGETLGEMTMTTVRRPDDKTLNGADYSSADGKVIFELKLTDKEIRTEMLTKKYTVIAGRQTYVDLNNSDNSYVLTTRHDGKNYYYSYDGAGEKRIRVGNSGYTDSMYIYHYIRSYPLSSPPSSLKIADPTTGSAITVGCTVTDLDSLDIPFPSGVKSVLCQKIYISLSDAPRGSGIEVWYTPDSTDYQVAGLSQSPSKKFPVKIIENDVTYTLKSISVA